MSQGQSNPNIAVSASSKVMTIFPGDYAAADEGSYFTANLAATASTAVATTTQALAKTNPTIAITNTSTPGGANSYNIYLRYIKLLMTAVTTGATTAQHVGTLDNLLPKLTTLGTALNAATNVNSASPSLSKSLIYGGVNVAGADTANGRTVHTGVITNSIPIILDNWIFAFGEPVAASAMIGTMTLVKEVIVPLPPIIIAPGWTYTLGIWGTSWAAAAQTYSIDMGWIERPSGQ